MDLRTVLEIELLNVETKGEGETKEKREKRKKIKLNQNPIPWRKPLITLLYISIS